MNQPNKLPSVEIRPALTWTCEECGRDNFEYCIAITSGHPILEELPDHIDKEAIQEWLEFGGSGELTMSPKQVTCKYCKKKFVTLDPDEIED